MLLSFWRLPLESVAHIQLLDVATLAKANVAAMAFLQPDVQTHVYELLAKMPHHLTQLPRWQNPALLASVFGRHPSPRNVLMTPP